MALKAALRQPEQWMGPGRCWHMGHSCTPLLTNSPLGNPACCLALDCMDELEFQHVNFHLHCSQSTTMQADPINSQTTGCPHPSVTPQTQSSAISFSLLWLHMQSITSGWWSSGLWAVGRRALLSGRAGYQPSIMAQPSLGHTSTETWMAQGTDSSQADLWDCTAHFHRLCVAVLCSWHFSCYSSNILHRGSGEQSMEPSPLWEASWAMSNLSVNVILRHKITRPDAVGFYAWKTTLKMSSNMRIWTVIFCGESVWELLADSSITVLWQQK